VHPSGRDFAVAAGVVLLPVLTVGVLAGLWVGLDTERAALLSGWWVTISAASMTMLIPQPGW
jgi:hypothetical protein